MSQTHRLAQGGRINRSCTIAFRFNGKTYYGHPGDTVASALLANGVGLAARSIKYRRPRGVFGMGHEEPNVLLQVGSGAAAEPDRKATEVALTEGLECSTVNGWPSVKRDLPAVATKLGTPLLGTGFYYKTFMWPAKAWPFYEQRIRQVAGSGYAPDAPDPARYERVNAHCDVIVVGGGAAGLAAALAAMRAGARVILADEQGELGGALLASHATIDDRPAGAWVQEAAAELRAAENATVLSRTSVFGRYHHGLYGLLEHCPGEVPVAARYWRLRAAQCVLASGALERLIAFGANDLPGVMSAAAMTTYLRRYAVLPGQRPVVFGNNDTIYTCAAALHDAGAAVGAVVDVRRRPEAAELAEQRGIRVLAETALARAHGRHSVSGASVVHRGDGATETLACDSIAVSGGWNPALQLDTHNGLSTPRYEPALATFVPGEQRPDLHAAGAVRGHFALEEALAEGYAAGAAAVAALGRASAEVPSHRVAGDDPTPGALVPYWESPQAVKRAAKAFVDLQNDVTAKDLRNAIHEGYTNIEHVKRYSVLGFGTDQGRLGNIVGAGIVAQELGEDLAEVGTTTFRPPYAPVTYGALAGMEQGELYAPIRTTPMHDWHVAAGAVFEDVGQWKRARYYPREGEDMDAAVRRECLATHQAVGVLDYSTLGKIEVRGPDAAELLNRVYTNGWKKLAVDRCRYGLMLDENGMVLDDGLSVRLGDDHYLMHTTTGGAARVLAWLEQWLQTEWPELRVFATSVTDQWSTVSLAGPQSRALLGELCDDLDLSGEAFPFMSCRHGTVAGVWARVMRVSFSGELCYEVSVPADYGLHLWEAVMGVGEAYGATPYGTETMHVLRAEKGFIIAGQDTDGSVSPLDLGMHGLVSSRKDCLGKRSLERADLQRTDRNQFVGLQPEDPEAVLPEGAQLVVDPQVRPPVSMHGYVTSSYFGARLGHAFALGMLERGRERHGERLHAWDVDAGAIPVRVTSPLFFDPKGERQNV